MVSSGEEGFLSLGPNISCQTKSMNVSLKVNFEAQIHTYDKQTFVNMLDCVNGYLNQF